VAVARQATEYAQHLILATEITDFARQEDIVAPVRDPLFHPLPQWSAPGACDPSWGCRSSNPRNFQNHCESMAYANPVRASRDDRRPLGRSSQQTFRKTMLGRYPSAASQRPFSAIRSRRYSPKMVVLGKVPPISGPIDAPPPRSGRRFAPAAGAEPAAQRRSPRYFGPNYGLGAAIDAMADQIEASRAEAFLLQHITELAGELADVAGNGNRRAPRTLPRAAKRQRSAERASGVMLQQTGSSSICVGLPQSVWVFPDVRGTRSGKAAAYGRGAIRRPRGSCDAASEAGKASCKARPRRRDHRPRGRSARGRGGRRDDRGAAGAAPLGQGMLQMRELPVHPSRRIFGSRRRPQVQFSGQRPVGGLGRARRGWLQGRP
jgi:hypothetical protein